VGVTKLTIDNIFNPKKDMSRVVDFSSLWFLGLGIGSTLSGLLSNPQQKFS
jgi:hypothetical protein